MNKTVATALKSVLLAAILSVVYFSIVKDRYAAIGWGLMGFAYVGIQLIAGLSLTSSKKEIGQGLIIGAGIILLIGFSVCSRM